ncbi:unnamed protein product [Lathyrus oleraceus]
MCIYVKGPWAGPRVDDTSFDGLQGRGPQPSGFTSRSCRSQESASRDTLEAYEEPAANAHIDSYPGGPFDTFLLHLYGDHAARRNL